MKKVSACLLPLLALASSQALAQRIEEIVVIGVKDTHTVRTEDTLVAPADTAQLLKKMPGANINKNGELTGIAQYRGMYGNRVNIAINGSKISSGGPNAMDAPLHYAPVALLESLTISRGIAPVSAGQETIGGQIDAVTYAGEFGRSDDFSFDGRAYLGGQSVNQGSVSSGFFSLANDNHLFRGFVMTEQADDSDFADGSITPSEYQRDRFDLGYSYRRGDHEFSIDFTRNNTGDAGTAALPMDIQSVDSDLINAKYQWFGDDLTLTAKFSMNEISHGMSNFHLRRPPQDNAVTAGAMRYRENNASSDNSGFSLKLEQDVDNGYWRYGIDGHFADHDSRVTNPNAGPFFISNFNGADKSILGVYLEREMTLSDSIGLEAGARYNRVNMDSDLVSANLNPTNVATGMPAMLNNMAAMLAKQFNSQNLEQKDNNIDWFSRLSIKTNSNLTWYVGAARKSRSPSYQERYLWIPLESTGGLADGKTYVGNASLDPEVAHEIELGFDWESNGVNIYPRIFYKDVSDFIQGMPASNATVNSLSQMMVNMGMGAPGPLQFTNVDAKFFGMDVESNFALGDRLILRAIASAVRGERKDVNDDLYRITPDNFILALDYLGNNWMLSVENMSYAKQDKVSATNFELETSGYSVVNISSEINLSDDLEIGLGIDNVFDKKHEDHLGGYNRAFNSDIPMRERLPGLGTSVYGRVIWRF